MTLIIDFIVFEPVGTRGSWENILKTIDVVTISGNLVTHTFCAPVFV